MAVATLAIGTGSALAAAPGAVDAAFGGGMVTLDLKTQLNGAALQPDGKLVVTGLSNGIDTPRLLVARYLPSGALDPGFGSGGLATAPAPANAIGTIGEDVAIQPDGKIVVAGRIRSDTGASGMEVVRYAANGTLDPSFGSGGVTDLFRGTDYQAAAMALGIRSNGEIVLGGQSSSGNGSQPTAALARVNSAGTLVSGPSLFGIGEAIVNGLAFQSDGKIVVVGSEKQGQSILGFLGRANADGSKDASFRGGGAVDQGFARNGAAGSALSDVGVQGDNRIIATGYAFDNAGGGTPGAFEITARYDASGNADGSFGSAGVTYVRAARSDSVNTGEPGGGSVIIDNGGHIYTAGHWDEFGSSALLANSQAQNGALEAGFGSGGQAIAPFSNYGQPAYGRDAALGTDGLYVVGTIGAAPSTNNDTSRGVVARLGSFPFVAPPQPPVDCVAFPTAPGCPGGTGGTVLAPAKLQLLSSSISKGKLKLRVGATSLASGVSLTVKYQTAGTTSTFKLKLPTVSGKPVVKSYTLTLKGKQKSKTTGIVTLSSPKTTKVNADSLRLRVAKNAAGLKRGTTKISAGKLVVSGTISTRAKGSILFRLDYVVGTTTKSFNAKATIKKGKWSLNATLPADAAKSGGQLAIQYTGNNGARIRGEQVSKAVTP